MTSVNVEIDNERDDTRFGIASEDIIIEVRAKNSDDFARLLEEIFGDGSTLAGQEMRKLLQDEAESGLSGQEVILAAIEQGQNQN